MGCMLIRRLLVAGLPSCRSSCSPLRAPHHTSLAGCVPVWLPPLQDQARGELERRIAAMNKRRKVHEQGEAGQRAHRIPAHRPATQQSLQVLAQQHAAAAAAAGGHAEPGRLQHRPPGLHAAHHRMTPPPAALAESLSAADLSTASLLALGPVAGSSMAAAAGGSGSSRHGWRHTQQAHPLGSHPDMDASRRSSAVGDLRVVGANGGGLGLTPRSTLAPRQQQSGLGGSTGADGRHEQQCRGGDALPLLKPALRHAATISVRAGPIPGQALPLEATASAAAAAAAAASKRRLVVEPEGEHGRGHLGPEDSLSYGAAKWGSPPGPQARAWLPHAREPAVPAGAAGHQAGGQQLHSSPSQTRLATAAGQRRQHGQQAQREEQQQQGASSTAAIRGTRLPRQLGRDQLPGAAAIDLPPSLLAWSSKQQAAGRRGPVNSTGAGLLPEVGPPPGTSSSLPHARQQQQGQQRQQQGQYGSPVQSRLPCTPPRSPAVPMSIDKQHGAATSEEKQPKGQGPSRKAVAASAMHSPPRSPSGLGLASSPSLRWVAGLCVCVCWAGGGVGWGVHLESKSGLALFPL